MPLLAWTLTLTLFFFLVENHGCPTPTHWRRAITHSSLFALNSCLLFLFVPFVFQSSFGSSNLSFISQFIVLVFVLDFISYVLHVLSHRIPFLFYFHQVHHSDNSVDASTGLRMHVVQMIYSLIPDVIVISVFAPSREAYLMYALFSQCCVLFHHAQFNVPVWLEYVMVTPRCHLEHHKQSLNFGSVFSFWDKLFGTWTNQNSRMPLGLPNVETALSARELFLPPRRVSQ